jgi:polyvinyl alcohol dehydrogenase (cytochrome)
VEEARSAVRENAYRADISPIGGIMKTSSNSGTLSYLFFLSAALLWAHPLHAQDGSKLFNKRCAVCHDGAAERMPSRDGLKLMTAEHVLAAIETGPMKNMAKGLSDRERRAIAEFITGKPLGQKTQSTPAPQNMCPGSVASFFDPSSGARWDGWGANNANTRFQNTALAGFTELEVPRLKLKWAFGFPDDTTAGAQPTLAGGRVFAGSRAGTVYSLDAATGCVHWWFAASTSVRTPVTVSRIGSGVKSKSAAYFGDDNGMFYALDAAIGKLLWKVKIDDQPGAHITGGAVVDHGRVYVPVAGTGEGEAISPSYQCCRFRGNVVALDAPSGKLIWRSYTIFAPAHHTTKNRIGTQLWGPSGAAIWSTPTIDAKRNALYVTTGDNYSDPATETSDAFLAFDLDSGKFLWSRQMTASDAYTVACRLPDKTNCPASNGPDFDFGASPSIVNLPNGKRALVAGQKSGVVWAIDPDNAGVLLWSTRVGKGGFHGGIQWGSATDDSNVYVALSDVAVISVPGTWRTETDSKQGGGMFALNLETGKILWHAPPAQCGERKQCSPAQSAAVSGMPGVAFSGALDGHLRAYSAKDGEVLWDFDTVGPWKTTNGVAAGGGSIDQSGPAIGAGMLFATSGYAVWGGMPGNVLLAFSVDGK